MVGSRAPGDQDMLRRRATLAIALSVICASVGGTAPAASQDAAEPVDRVSQLIEGMTLRQKVGQLFASRVYGARADDPAAGARRANRRDLGADDARELVERYHVGSVVYFEYTGNLGRPAQIARLSNGIQQAAAEAGLPPVLISTDQEHGVIRRLGPPATQLPGAMAIGATRDTGLARKAARVTGEELRAVGVRQNLAPVADVNVNPRNPVIGIRSFGSQPGPVASMVGAQVRGLQEDTGVAATVKHFPGHGDTDLDSHTSLPTIRHSVATWWAVDAPPFQAAIDAGTEVIMTAHVVVPALDPSRRPATLSPAILTGVLREQMGYEGVVMTDSLTMAAVRQRFGDLRVPVLALKAGADILADPPNLPRAFRAVLDAVEDGELTEERIEESVERVLRLKDRLGLLDDPMVNPEMAAPSMGTEEHQAVAEAIGEASVTVLRLGPTRRLPTPEAWSILLTGWSDEGVETLEDALRAAGREVETRWTGERPTKRQIAAVVRAQRRHDITVVLTGYLGADPRQRQLVRQLRPRGGGRTIIVSARSPYDVAWFPSAPVLVAAYGSTPVSMRALAGIIEGEIGPAGTSPVRIPYPGRPETLFPFGSGVTW
jgi:beta-N-acetylhexosaminidase